LCFKDLILNTKDTKVSTKAHKGLLRQPPMHATSLYRIFWFKTFVIQHPHISEIYPVKPARK
jgi:hypothetical protein